MSAVKITQKIKGFKVVNEAEEQALAAAAEAASVVQMDETLERPDTLIGATYKIKSPLFEHALYVTINDMVLNAGTAHEQRRPFEIFINSKNMDHFQWIVALTRIMSAVFRKGGDCTFLVEELKAVFDPRGLPEERRHLHAFHRRRESPRLPCRRRRGFRIPQASVDDLPLPALNCHHRSCLKTHLTIAGWPQFRKLPERLDGCIGSYLARRLPKMRWKE